MSNKSEEEVLNLAKKIISLDESTNDPRDKSYIHCIKFIFTNESDKGTLKLPTTKKDKKSFQYLKDFVNALAILFEKNEEERHKLYLSEVTSKELGINLYQLIQNLKLFVNRKKLGDSESKEFTSLNEKVNTVFCQYLKTMDNTLFGCLNLYFYYLGFFIESVESFEFMLFYFLQIDKAFDRFEYKDYCPDLNSANCLNLIILFFKSVISNDSLELLSIYALVIFKYKYIFRGIEDNIKESILEKSVRETVSIVKKKTLKNSIIFEYIFLKFYNNLKYNIYSIYSPIMENETITAEESKKERKIGKNEDSNLSMQTNESNNKKIKEGCLINEKDNKNNNINQEQVFNKNTINSNKIDVSSQINISGKPLIKREGNSKEKNSINEGAKKGKKYKKEKLDSIDDKANDNSKNSENNNNVDKIKEPKDSCRSTENKSSKSDLTKKDECTKNEGTKGYQNESNLLVIQREASPEIQDLINIININNKRNDERYDELKKRSDERYDELQTKYVTLKNQLENVQEENKKITDILGKIQMRDSVKNILSPFEIYLTEEDKMKINKDRNLKWKMIAQRAKEYYIKYNNSRKYMVFAEIMDKSAELMAKGNNAAHDIFLEYYEKDINRIIEELIL